MSSYVCEDLVANIFERLPHKSVLRFRSLSKSWCSRLASPDFVRMHTLRSLNNNTSHQKVLLRHSFRRDGADIFTLHSRGQLPLNPKRAYMGIAGVKFPYEAHIIGSCNGILCLRTNNGLILWNFSVRRKLVVPTHPSIGASKRVHSDVFGFVYDQVTHDYNIVCISYSNDERVAYNVNSFIYSMRTNSWSLIAPPTSLFTNVRSNACFLNGNLHWVVLYFGATDSNFILTFNLTTRVFGTIQLPKNWQQENDVHQLTIINGSLAVICRTWDDFIIWLMREYDNVESWFMFFQLQTKGYDDDINVLQPITNDNLVIYHKSSLRIYDDKKKSFTEIQKFIPTFGKIEMEMYAESLELLDRGIPCGTTVFPWTITCEHKRRFTSLNNDVDIDNDGGRLIVYMMKALTMIIIIIIMVMIAVADNYGC